MFVRMKLNEGLILLAIISATFLQYNSSFSALSSTFNSNFRNNKQLCVSSYFKVRPGRLPVPAVPMVENNEFGAVDIFQNKIAIENVDVGPIASMNSLDTIIPRKTINDLTRTTLSDIKGFEQLLWHIGFYSFSGLIGSLAITSYVSCLTSWSVFGRALFFPFLPRLLSFLSLFGMSLASGFIFNVLHETVHQTAFKSKGLNRAVMHLTGFLCLRPARHYQYYHWQHHRHTGDPDLDSELQKSALDMDVSNIFGYILYLSGIPFWFDALTTTVRHALGADHCREMYLSTAQARVRVATEARWYLTLYAAVAAIAIRWHSLGAILGKYWILPAVLGQPMLRFYLLG